MSTMSLVAKVKLPFTLFVILAILTPAVVGYAYRWRLSTVTDFAISVYGLYSLAHLAIQIVCASLNKRRMDKEVADRPEGWNDIRVGICVAGYREDAFYFEECLQSIKKSKYSNIARVICIVDGNDEGDKYMADVYRTVFNDNVVVLDYLISEKNATDIDFSLFGNNNEPVCIMQPHKGKREAQYTGFSILLNDSSVQGIITTDSDTILDENAVLELAYPLRHEYIGAVAGQISVWNTNSLLTFVIALRYWFSFNLERGCQSFWRTVLCIAGPMGCYKASVIKDVKEKWLKQKFLGQPCTYGDDRHLTNQILGQDLKVCYTPHALGHTDTPPNIFRYLIQQTRWGKSYIREFLFSIPLMHKHPLWLGYELFYHMVYFFLMMYWTLYLLFGATIRQQFVAIAVTMVLGIVKSIYGVICTRNWRFIYFYLYTYVYFFVIIPSKLTALVTLWDVSWGTRGSVSSQVLTFITNYTMPIVWYGAMSAGFLYNLINNLTFKWDDKLFRSAFVGILSHTTFVAVSIITYAVLQYTGLLRNSTLDYLEEKKEKQKISNTSNHTQEVV